MAFTADKVASEFLVNTQTLGNQSSPAVAGLGEGNFVVIWQDASGTLGDASGFSIKAQLFAADGNKISSEFLVNSQTTSHQLSPTVTALSEGGFVVTWYDFSGSLGDNSGTSIKAQVFTADGTKVGSEFLVNTQTAGFQQHPTITGLSNGGFVVSWEDTSGTLGDSSGTSIKAQVFAADGTKVGSEFLVNTSAANVQTSPAITGLSNGGFVVSWQDTSGTLGDGSGASVKAQLFDADGTKVGTEFLVDTQTAGNQTVPTITGLANGGFVVSWQDASGTLGDASGTSIKAQVFAADGSKVGSEFLVNTEVAHDQLSPSVTALSNGDFVVAWQDASGITAQIFASDGTRIGTDSLVNAQVGGTQASPKITALSNGGFAVTWQDGGGTLGDTSGTSIKAQVYVWDTTPPSAPTIADASVIDGVVNAAGNTAAQVLGGTAEADSVVKIYLNGAVAPAYTTKADGNGNWSVTIGHLADGSYSYRATATDQAGNPSAASAALNFVVDTIPPVLTITSFVPGVGESGTMTGTIDAADGGQTITLVDATFPLGAFPGAWSATTTADASGHWSISDVPLTVLNSPAVYAYDAAGNLGLSQYVFTESWSAGTSLSAGAHQYVLGISNDLVVESGAQQNVNVGGLAEGAVIRGTQIDWGIAIDTTIEGGTQHVWGSASNTTISGGVQNVAGAADGTIVNGGGQQIIFGGGSADGTSVHGGSQSVYGAADHTMVDSGGFQFVFGSATNTTISSGHQNIYESGIATGTTLNSNGVQVDWGTAVDTTLNGATQFVWGSASDTTLNGGIQHVAGSATGTTLNAATQHVYAGATANDTTINLNGSVLVDAGGSIHNVIFGGPSATLDLIQSSAFSGTISGLQPGDVIDLHDVAFNNNSYHTYVANADHSGGTLTVSDRVHTATLAFVGQANLVVYSDGHGGTDIATNTFPHLNGIELLV
jgi:autotransporter passenger strand-loop-strand repeat protein